ncbi:glycosyl transferase family 2 [Lacinutrix venerupis]|uniref:glycosyltransferase n=1 Tax=Lacinutrix venerupis TaxID=1486034 RepID=UPI000EB5BDE0|nr:glycosyltransferase [Lacinutrix venerupis]RLJ64376.1 glycosyl transferase family 2 [Lacinutrix venerupis]
MRTGVNPEKYKDLENKRYAHRIIIPVYIPNLEDEYYKNSLVVFKTCLENLVNTIDHLKTAITVINNNSCAEVGELINSYSSFIEKVVIYKENKGKVYGIIDEVRGVFEPYVTICDADVLFLKGWEENVFKIFNTYKKAGVVAPLPCQGLAFKNNSAVFFDSFFTNSLKYGKIVSEDDNKLYIEGLGNEAILNRNNREFHWYEKQYYLKKDDVVAIIGSGHFVATYKSEIFKNENSFPEIKFINGYEDKFIDILADKNNMYRLSTAKAYAYHIGNQLDNNIDKLIKRSLEFKVENTYQYKDVPNSKRLNAPFGLRKLFFRVLKKYKKL